ncbi:MAG TPA: hypothetical protein VI320_26365 [Terracidiphilus sp.]|jgi:hypothetical protein
MTAQDIQRLLPSVAQDLSLRREAVQELADPEEAQGRAVVLDPQFLMEVTAGMGQLARAAAMEALIRADR